MAVCPTGRHPNSHHGRCTCGRAKGGGGAQFRSSDARYRRATGAPRRNSAGFSSTSARNAAANGGGCLIMSVLLSLGAVLLSRLVRR